MLTALSIQIAKLSPMSTESFFATFIARQSINSLYSIICANFSVIGILMCMLKRTSTEKTMDMERIYSGHFMFSTELPNMSFHHSTQYLPPPQEPSDPGVPSLKLAKSCSYMYAFPKDNKQSRL